MTHRPAVPTRRLPHRVAPSRGGQRGVASLVVVMVLFFIVALVAAYTSRNLIFEQRTSGNQYRSTKALEAAEAGLEWALSRLDHGRIDAACEPSSNSADTSFRQRYLSIDASTGIVTAAAAAAAGPAFPTCVFDAGHWRCACPTNAAPSLAAPTDAGTHPAFRIHFTTDTSKPGLVRIDANGCTVLSETCLRFPSPAGVTDEGRATVSALVALASGVAAPPVAAVTARGQVNAGGGLGLAIVNTEAGVGGLTVHAGGTVASGGLSLQSVPGSPPDGSIAANDAAAMPPDADRMFASVFNLWRDSYRQQPAAVLLDCAVVTCNAATLRASVALNPGRVFWVQGNLSLDSPGDIGSASEPVTLVVTGDLAFADPTLTVYGLVYGQAADWSLTGGGRVQGAVVAEGNLGGTATTSIVYDAQVLQRLHLTSGSFVRVPGGWKDY